MASVSPGNDPLREQIGKMLLFGFRESRPEGPIGPLSIDDGGAPFASDATPPQPSPWKEEGESDSTPINGMAERPAAKRPSRTKSGVAAQDSFPEGLTTRTRGSFPLPLSEAGTGALDALADSRTVNEHARRLIEELAVGGVILMGRNIGPPDELRTLTAELQRRNAALGRLPLFIAVDQEGGRVARLRPPHYMARPGALEIGKTGWTGKARITAAEIGEELASVGINWDFAPVLDVNNNPHNPVIGDRSYGDDPQLVASMGVAAVLGFQEDAGLLACGKHFPGHGDTDVDSHRALPVAMHDRARLDRVELAPFRAAIDAGLAAVMTAHMLFPAIDPNLPATLSGPILTGILRRDLGFEGLIITDCLEMKGVADRWGSCEAAVLAVEAGADILLCCHTWETQLAISDTLCAAVRSGRLPMERIDQSTARIAAAKQRWAPGH